MAWKLIQSTKLTPTITIREYYDDKSADVKRYFRAVIQGWRNFKFSSDSPSSMKLLEKTIAKCRELDQELISNPSSIETMPTTYTFN